MKADIQVACDGSDNYRLYIDEDLLACGQTMACVLEILQVVCEEVQGLRPPVPPLGASVMTYEAWPKTRLFVRERIRAAPPAPTSPTSEDMAGLIGVETAIVEPGTTGAGG